MERTEQFALNQFEQSIRPLWMRSKETLVFLNYEAEEGKKLFFHISEVKGNSSLLHSGDIVEFVVVHNQRSGKNSACSITKISEGRASQRPERLISRMKVLSMEDSTGPRIVLIRQPRGPDGSKGFSIPR